MNKLKISLALIALLGGVFSCALPAQADSWQIESGVFKLAKDQVIDGDLFFSGEKLEIDGTIQGDLVLFSEEVTVNGRVEGSILGVVSGKLKINGTVGGSFRGLVREAYISNNGAVNGSFTGVAVKLFAEAGSLIEDGILGHFTELDLQGRIFGPVSITSIKTILGGEIRGNLRVKGAPVKWAPPLTVTGKVIDLTGYDNNPAKLEGVRLEGGYHQQKPVQDQFSLMRGVAIFSFIWFVGTLLTSLVLYRLFPKTAWSVTEPSAANFRRSLLVGLIGLIGLPILIIILTITIVGLPLALLLGMFYVTLLIFASVPLNLWVGRLLFKSRLNPVLMIVLGSLFLTLVKFLPIVSLLVNPLLSVLGVGMIISNIRPQLNQYLNNKINA